MPNELTAYATHIKFLRGQYLKCCSSPYKQMGLRRLRDAEYFLSRNFTYAMSLIDHGKAYLTYAQEFDHIQQLRKEALARTGLEEMK